MDGFRGGHAPSPPLPFFPCIFFFFCNPASFGGRYCVVGMERGCTLATIFRPPLSEFSGSDLDLSLKSFLI